MEEKKLLFDFEDKKIINQLFENVSELIKDSDAIEEKEIVKRYMQALSKDMSIVCVGKSQSGKTSLLNQLFQDDILKGGSLYPTVGIREYRNGAEEVQIQVEEEHWRIFRQESSLKGVAVYDTQGLDQLSDRNKKKILELTEKSSVVLIVFSADAIRDYLVWDFIENVNANKMIFVQTKCDLLSEEDIKENEKKLTTYMKEAGTAAPIFCVSIKQKYGCVEDDCRVICRYMLDNIIGPNPMMTQQIQNINSMKEMLEKLCVSLESRKKQYLEDEKILRKINSVIDSFREKNQNIVELLKRDLRNVVEQQINTYQDDIIKKLDPQKIKERFPRGSNDFIDYMNFVNDTYRKRMTEQINKKTQDSIRKYLSQLEIVFQEATGYFKERESLLELEDQFYGSLSESRKIMVLQTSSKIEATCGYYQMLSDASEELFMKVWNARNSYDNKILGSQIAGAGVGAIAGTVGTQLLLVKAIGVATAGVWPVVGLS